MWADKFIDRLYSEACMMKLDQAESKSEPSFSEHEKFKPSTPPEDWAKRDNQGKWTPPPVGRTSGYTEDGHWHEGVPNGAPTPTRPSRVSEDPTDPDYHPYYREDGQPGQNDHALSVGKGFRAQRREARKKQAFFGQPIVGHHHVPGWTWDQYQNGYRSHTGSVFVCGCGSELSVPSHQTCKCGRIWNSYPIASGPTSKEASVDVFFCREIPVREGVIMANNRRSGK